MKESDKVWPWLCRFFKCIAVGTSCCLLGLVADLKPLQIIGSCILLIPTIAWLVLISILAFHILRIIPDAIMEYGKEIAIVIAILTAIGMASRFHEKNSEGDQPVVFNAY
jgi:hypothetical protein